MSQAWFMLDNLAGANLYAMLNRIVSITWIQMLLVLIIAILAGRALSDLTQVIIGGEKQSTDSLTLYSPPTYNEVLHGEAGWRWSSYRDVYRQIEQESVPQIELSVRLVGILDLGRIGFAMMQVEDQPEKLYKLQDYVRGNIRIMEISTNSVTLSDGISSKTYELYNEESNIFLQAPAVQGPQVTNLIGGSAPTRQIVSVNTLPAQQRNKIVFIENSIRENPLAASNDFNLGIVNRNGQVYGYQVDYKIDPALLRSIGLLPTDIVISVNGVPSATIASDNEVMTDLLSQNNFEILYERQGAINTLNLSR